MTVSQAPEGFVEVAEHLKREREERRLGTQKIALQLQVPESTVLQLEEPASSTLPIPNAYGLYIRYAQLMKLDDYAIESTLNDALEVDSITNRRKSLRRLFNFRYPGVFLSRIVRYSLLSLVVLLVMGYALRQAVGIVEPPALVLDVPADAWSVQQPTIILEGYSDAEATVFIAGQPITLNEDNSFRELVHLQEGINPVEVTAVNTFARTRTRSLRISYNPYQIQ